MWSYFWTKKPQKTASSLMLYILASQDSDDIFNIVFAKRSRFVPQHCGIFYFWWVKRFRFIFFTLSLNHFNEYVIISIVRLCTGIFHVAPSAHNYHTKCGDIYLLIFIYRHTFIDVRSLQCHAMSEKSLQDFLFSAFSLTWQAAFSQ